MNLDYFISEFFKKPELRLLIKIEEMIDEPIGSFIINDNYTRLLHVRQSEETMKYLLDRGGDPNVTDLNFITPVLLQSDYNVIRLLEDRGANLNHRDTYNFGIFHWQKDAETVEYLVMKGIDIHSYCFIYEPKTESIYSERNKMLIEGGYDPYSENYISIPGYFLQRDLETIYMYLKLRIEKYPEYINTYDLFGETILCKPFLTRRAIILYISGGEDINSENLFGNTPLFIQHDEDIIEELIYMGANLEHQNSCKDTPKKHHLIKNNRGAYTKINNHLSAKIIQRCWRRWKFKKNWIPYKNFVQKKEFLQEIYYLPPLRNEMKQYFEGGLGYQLAFEDFTLFSSLQGKFYQ